MSEGDGDQGEPDMAVVLDFLPHGRADDDRPGYQKSPLAYAVGVEDFRLYELQASTEAAPGIDEEVAVSPPADWIERVRTVDFEDLSGGARSELEYVVEDLVGADEGRFLEFYNEAGPITLRLHQLNLLPGIGTKLRDAILEERDRDPFESFEEIHERVAGLHDPRGVVVDRIMEELQESDLKYRIFTRREDAGT